MLTSINKFHFIGIGGAGMSAIAKILLQMGYSVSGSDIAKSDTVDKLEKLGAKIFIGHNSANILDAEAIIVSTAISGENPEVVAARTKGIYIFHRSEVIAALMTGRLGIAVAGAHGKTTTTSMVALMLEKAGLDPTVIIGGEVECLGGNAKLGIGKYLVAEADESDGSFLKLEPHIAIVTNIENDHMDYYGTMEKMLDAFEKFLRQLPDNGLAVLCFDDAHVRDIAANLNRRYISYGLEHDAEYTARDIRTQGSSTFFNVLHNGEKLGEMRLNVPGRHNVANSLAAIIVGINAGLTFAEIADGLAAFQGAKRRFQTKGRVSGIWVVDDYAHHPTEITTTLLAARQTEPKRLICVFQPHRYSRTQLLKREFGSAFTPTDILVLTDVYSAGENPIPGINGEVIKDEVEKQTEQAVTYIPDYKEIPRFLARIVEPGDLVMTMGAGNIYAAGEELVEILIENQ